MQLLLKNGADIDTQGGYYGDSLQAASIQGYSEIVQLLLENGAHIQRSELVGSCGWDSKKRNLKAEEKLSKHQRLSKHLSLSTDK